MGQGDGTENVATAIIRELNETSGASPLLAGGQNTESYVRAFDLLADNWDPRHVLQEHYLAKVEHLVEEATKSGNFVTAQEGLRNLYMTSNGEFPLRTVLGWLRDSEVLDATQKSELGKISMPFASASIFGGERTRQRKAIQAGIDERLGKFKGNFIVGTAIGAGAGILTYTAGGDLAESGEIAFKTAVPYGSAFSKLSEGDERGATHEAMTESAGIAGAIGGAWGGAALCSPSGPGAIVCGIIGGIGGGLGLGMGTDALLNSFSGTVDSDHESVFGKELTGGFNTLSEINTPHMAKIIYDHLALDQQAGTPELEALMEFKKLHEATGNPAYYGMFENQVGEMLEQSGSGAQYILPVVSESAALESSESPAAPSEIGNADQAKTQTNLLTQR